MFLLVKNNFYSGNTGKLKSSLNINYDNNNSALKYNSERRTSRNSLNHEYQIQMNKRLCNRKNKI